jgi:arylsulfatase A-like enzyme
MPDMNRRRALGLMMATGAAVLTENGRSFSDITPPPQLKKPNVLFIAIDDLNHWVGYLGRNPQTKTPHIDRLASRGVWFTRSFCAAPACNPSRTAVMSGLRPSTSGVY